MLDPLDTLGPVWTPDPVVRSHPLNHGRVGWWLTVPGLDGGRQWFDLMGLYPGTLTNMTTSASGWRGTTRPGGSGHLQFDGVDDAVAGPTAIPWWAGNLTLACWVNPTNFANYNGLVTKTNGSSPAPWDWYLVQTSGIPSFLTGPGGGGQLVNASAAPPTGSWSRLVVTLSGLNAAHYLNGKPNGSGTLTSVATDGGTAIEIGNRGDGFTKFTGGVDDATIWSRALSAAEVAADNDLSRRGYPGVLRRWPGMGAALMAPPGGFPAYLNWFEDM